MRHLSRDTRVLSRESCAMHTRKAGSLTGKLFTHHQKLVCADGGPRPLGLRERAVATLKS